MNPIVDVYGTSSAVGSAGVECGCCIHGVWSICWSVILQQHAAFVSSRLHMQCSEVQTAVFVARAMDSGAEELTAMGGVGGPCSKTGGDVACMLGNTAPTRKIRLHATSLSRHTNTPPANLQDCACEA
jgi:hypothetical protein